MSTTHARTGEAAEIAPGPKRPVPTRPDRAGLLLRRDLYWYGLSKIGMTQDQIAEASGFHQSAVCLRLKLIRVRFRSGCPELASVLRSMLEELEGPPDA